MTFKDFMKKAPDRLFGFWSAKDKKAAAERQPSRIDMERERSSVLKQRPPTPIY